MKRLLVLFFVLLTPFVNSQEANRVLTFNARVIYELNEPLNVAIERHIDVSKAKRIKNRNDYFILISIFPSIKEWEVSKSIFDSIYAVNDLNALYPSDSITPTYSISIRLASKKYMTEGWIGFGRKNIFYCKENDYDLLIDSDLNLRFKTVGEMKHIVIQLIDEQKSKRRSPYKIWTGYSMWNKYITEIRFKDLVWPSWTGNRDDFK